MGGFPIRYVKIYQRVSMAGADPQGPEFQEEMSICDGSGWLKQISAMTSAMGKSNSFCHPPILIDGFQMVGL